MVLASLWNLFFFFFNTEEKTRLEGSKLDSNVMSQGPWPRAAGVRERRSPEKAEIQRSFYCVEEKGIQLQNTKGPIRAESTTSLPFSVVPLSRQARGLPDPRDTWAVAASRSTWRCPLSPGRQGRGLDGSHRTAPRCAQVIVQESLTTLLGKNCAESRAEGRVSGAAWRAECPCPRSRGGGRPPPA